MQVLTGMPNWLIVGIVSMVPLIELRGGLIAAALLGMPLWEGILFCLIGNIIPVPFILLFITPIFNWLKTTKLFRPLVEKIEARSMGKSEKIKKAEFWGLVLFVGIPIPGTGAWTGMLAASFLDMDFKKSTIAVMGGVLLAGVIIGLLSLGGINLLNS